MKYLCLGYMEEGKWDTMSESERNTFMKECFAYDEELQKNGHWVGGIALQSSTTATTLRYLGHKVSMTDGPYAETKEQLGGLMTIEATDLNHAIQLMSKHPNLKLGGGAWEIRPTEDLDAMIASVK
jgi:hypothetical protein